MAHYSTRSNKHAHTPQGSWSFNARTTESRVNTPSTSPLSPWTAHEQYICLVQLHKLMTTHTAIGTCKSHLHHAHSLAGVVKGCERIQHAGVVEEHQAAVLQCALHAHVAHRKRVHLHHLFGIKSGFAIF